MIPHPSLTCTTGESCPASGIWESMGNFITTVVIAKGSPLPAYCGAVVRWRLVRGYEF